MKDLHFPGAFDTELIFGPYMAINEACNKIGCIRALKKAFPDYWLQIFALSMHAVVSGNSIGQDFSYWSFHNYCGISKQIYSGQVSTIYKNISENKDSIDEFIKLFKNEYWKVFNKSEELVFAFDSTNFNTASNNIDYAEYGHAKDDKNFKIVNTAIFVDEITGIPLYYEDFYGSILDKTETPITIEKITNLGFQKIFLMMDRGYFSQEVIDSLKEYLFGISCPSSLDFVKKLINDTAILIKDNENVYIPEHNIYGNHKKKQKICNGEFDAYLFYDPIRAEEEKSSIHQRISNYEEKISKRKKYSDKLREKYYPWIEIEKTTSKKNGKDFVFKRNNEIIQEYIDNAGFFVVISNSGYNVKKMISIVRKRDVCEKSFRRIKSHFDQATLYCHNTKTYNGKMFVTFIALIMVEAYRWYVKSELNALSSNTTAKTLNELGKYIIKQKEDMTWMPKYAMTKTQKDLFKCLDLDESQVIEEIRALELRV